MTMPAKVSYSLEDTTPPKGDTLPRIAVMLCHNDEPVRIVMVFDAWERRRAQKCALALTTAYRSGYGDGVAVMRERTEGPPATTVSFATRRKD
jgi:hypothetical protein